MSNESQYLASSSGDLLDEFTILVTELQLMNLPHACREREREMREKGRQNRWKNNTMVIIPCFVLMLLNVEINRSRVFSTDPIFSPLDLPIRSTDPMLALFHFSWINFFLLQVLDYILIIDYSIGSIY